VFTPDQYQLIDFGKGRRLERFGALRLDRPCPAVETVAQSTREAWHDVDARFDRAGSGDGRWSSAAPVPDRWTIRHGQATFELKQAPAGHLGVFPEQAANWDWIAERLQPASPPLKVLNLFAYTGGSTLAAAAAGAEVVHVDAARNTVAWARHNAELSGMAELPIHWITEDAQKFARREVRRGNQYDAVILDPPSYGHGTRGEVWRLTKHLPRLLELCAELTAGRRRFLLLTCHTPGFDSARLETMVSEALGPAEPGHVTGRVAAEPLTIRSAAAAMLPCGMVVRWQREP
jgi:23S rRNA (cytosine1962-C5)-methyltransferase